MKNETEGRINLYLGYGFPAIVGVPRGEKGPKVKGWQNLNDGKAYEVRPGDNIGGVLGDKIICLDFETPAGLDTYFGGERDNTLIVKTGGKGNHVYYSRNGASLTPQQYFNGNGDLVAELRTGRQQCLLPPSVHPSGRRYEIINTPEKLLPFEPEKHKERMARLGKSREEFNAVLEAERVKIEDDRGGSDIFKTIKRRVSVQDVLSLLGLPTTGRIRCPIHGGTEAHPEPMAIYPDIGIVKCWSEKCRFSGDSIKLYSAVRGLSPIDAARQLAEHFNVSLPKPPEKTAREEKKPLELKPISGEELLSMEYKPREFLIEGIIPKATLTIIAGSSGVGKSWFSLLFGGCVSKGKPFLDKFQVKKTPVLIVESENGMNELQRRTAALGGKELFNEVEFLSFPEGLTLDDEHNSGLAWLADYCELHPEPLIIFDTFSRFVSFDENEAPAMAGVIGGLKLLCEKRRATLILLHHPRKAQARDSSERADRLRGSSEMRNYADSIIFITRNQGGVVIDSEKTRFGGNFESFRVLIPEGNEKISFTYGGAWSELKVQNRTITDALLKALFETGKNEFRRKEVPQLLQRAGAARFDDRAISRALAWATSREVGLLLHGEKKGRYIVPGGQSKITEANNDDS